MKTEVTVLGDQLNAVVIQLPSRKFPAIAIQGDSLSILYSLIEDICESVGKIQPLLPVDDETLDLSFELKDLIKGYVAAYESALSNNDISLPYYGSKLK